MNAQSKLVELPCAIGDPVYWRGPFGDSVWSGIVAGVIVREGYFVVEINTQSGTPIKKELQKCFFTREEALEVQK